MTCCEECGQQPCVCAEMLAAHLALYGDEEAADEEYAREPVRVYCPGCARMVYVVDAEYDSMRREWWCDECLEVADC